tara:strand:+ start:195 stop:611 length:417 start_codon:yes stop_codon:yes gene_type:complete
MPNFKKNPNAMGSPYKMKGFSGFGNESPMKHAPVYDPDIPYSGEDHDHPHSGMGKRETHEKVYGGNPNLWESDVDVEGTWHVTSTSSTGEESYRWAPNETRSQESDRIEEESKAVKGVKGMKNIAKAVKLIASKKTKK